MTDRLYYAYLVSTMPISGNPWDLRMWYYSIKAAVKGLVGTEADTQYMAVLAGMRISHDKIRKMSPEDRLKYLNEEIDKFKAAAESLDVSLPRVAGAKN